MNSFGEFMTGIVNASDSDEAKEVIASFVAPSNTFIQKRSTIHSFSSLIFLKPDLYYKKDTVSQLYFGFV